MNNEKTTHTYKVNDKTTFIVTPVYRKEKGESLHAILLNLMKAELAEAA
jgi:hypothetical protein